MAYKTTAEKKIREWLNDNGKTVEWLAEHLGLTRAAVYNILDGARPRKNISLKLKELCGIEDDYVS